jgi:hypothetical protein
MTKKNSLSLYDEIKQFIADPKLRIKLYDYVRTRSDDLIAATTEELFPLNAKLNSDEFASRLKPYEEASADLIAVMSLIGLWGTLDHQLSISVPVKQFSIHFGKDTRSNIWTSLRLYPLVLFMYAIGIGAITANNFSILYSFFQSTFNILSYPFNSVPFVYAVQEGFRAAQGSFKLLPDHKKDFSPASEYLFNFFKGQLKDIFLLGNEYEDIFDRFELIYALQYAHEREKISGNIWGPVGRSGWKYSRGVDDEPFRRLCDEASRNKEAWIPLGAGFFGGSYEQFEKLALKYAQDLKSYH